MATIRMYCAPWCGDCRAAERFLDEAGVAYEPINIEEHPEAAELIIEKNNGKRKVPTFEVDGRWFAVSPFDPELLARELGLDA
ncbi:MAG: glutaredoxin family protein [Candidatus Acidiferrales bacterium]